MVVHILLKETPEISKLWDLYYNDINRRAGEATCEKIILNFFVYLIG